MKLFSGTRMGKAEFPRVKRLPRKIFDRGLCARRQKPRFGFKSRAINGIADQGMAKMSHMDTDLMRATGFELAGDESGHGRACFARKAGFDFVMRHRFAAPTRFDHSHAVPMG